MEFVRAQQSQGVLKPGQYVPAERQLAETCRVSRVTVRRALAQLVREGVVLAEPRKGYRILPVTRHVAASARTSTIVFVHTHSEAHMLFTTRNGRIWAGACDEARHHGLVSLLTCIPRVEMTPRRARDVAAVAGGVICDEPDKSYLRMLLETGVPLVQVDYHRYPDLPTDAVVQDDVGGIFLAVEYLYRHGHRKIGYVDTTPRYRAEHRSLNAEQRLAGFKGAIGQLGIAEQCVVEPCTVGVARMVDRFLRQGVSALVFPHVDDWLAVYAELERRGISIPSDFGVVVWGSKAEIEDGLPSPTTIVWNQEQMGREAVRRLLRHMRGEKPEPATILIPCRLIDRGTGGRGPVEKQDRTTEESLRLAGTEGGEGGKIPVRA